MRGISDKLRGCVCSEVADACRGVGARVSGGDCSDDLEVRRTALKSPASEDNGLRGRTSEQQNRFVVE
eukprot:scaffold431464_cov46-Prasinocladus_malaysianus.AAC.1